MAHEITKWKPRSLCPESIERSLAIIRGGGELPARQQLLPAARSSGKPRRLDVLTLCAQHDRWSGAVYLLEKDGSYKYSTSIQITETIRRAQYAPGTQEIQVVDSRWIGEQTCAWCGVSGRGAFECGACKRPVGHCRSTGMYFRCTEICPGEGWAEERSIKHIGIVPRIVL
jgi:hypothetical protein